MNIVYIHCVKEELNWIKGNAVICREIFSIILKKYLKITIFLQVKLFVLGITLSLWLWKFLVIQ